MKAVSDWWSQRLTAFILLMLLPWLALNTINTGPHYWVTYFTNPFAVMGLILIFFSALYHVYLGTIVILEDYVSNVKIRTCLIQWMKIKIFVTVVFSVVCFIRLIVLGVHH
jgi:succinate dehydrogenase hydrophobic membrane anchor protein